jgi:hypothetical protein
MESPPRTSHTIGGVLRRAYADFHNPLNADRRNFLLAAPVNSYISAAGQLNAPALQSFHVLSVNPTLLEASET